MLRVVGPAGYDDDPIPFDAIDEAVFFVDAPAPVPLQFMFQRLWLADTFVTAAVNVFHQLVDAFQNFSVLSLPVKIIIPGFIGPGL